jgi:hypothetical protein
MSILIKPEHRRIDLFRFRINCSDAEIPENQRDVSIQFVNGKFDSAYYNFTGIHTRYQWKVLGAIAGMIGLLEKKLEEGQK